MSDREFMSLVLKHFPNALVEEDDGELVIYTGLKLVGDEVIDIRTGLTPKD